MPTSSTSLTPIERGATGVVKPRYTHKSTRGTRVAGFEDVNFTVLATDISKIRGIRGNEEADTPSRSSSGHVAEALSFKRNMSLKLFIGIADALGLTLAEMGARLDYARRVSQIKAAAKGKIKSMGVRVVTTQHKKSSRIQLPGDKPKKPLVTIEELENDMEGDCINYAYLSSH